jgi:hypothetical protein
MNRSAVREIVGSIEGFSKDLFALMQREALGRIQASTAQRFDKAVRSALQRKTKLDGATFGPEHAATSLDPNELERLATRILEYVTEYPGTRAEQIAKGLELAADDLVHPLKHLVTTKRIAARGDNRASEYWAL